MLGINTTKAYLSRSGDFVFGFYAIMATFICYTGMYAFRKAIAVGIFEGEEFLGIDYKILLIMAQVMGYAVSKFIGIKMVSEITPLKRATSIIILVGISAIALLLFAVTPSPVNIIFLFLNGLPLGIIFGLIFNYIEGRRLTEVLVIGLIATQVFSSGLVKATGKYLMLYHHVSDYWMPLLTGLIFFPFFLISVWMLESLPEPDKEDKESRSLRTPMNRNDRVRLVSSNIAGLVPFIISYIILTSFRDYRDNFAADIWNSLGFGHLAGNFIASEIPITIIVIMILILIRNIRSNITAFIGIHVIGMAGALLMLITSTMFISGMISPFWWISLTGMGLYITYIIANSIYFERFIATFRIKGNAGFVIMLADFCGYCGSIAVLMVKNFFNTNMSHQQFYLNGSILTALIVLGLWLFTSLYFGNKYKKQKEYYEYKISSI